MEDQHTYQCYTDHNILCILGLSAILWVSADCTLYSKLDPCMLFCQGYGEVYWQLGVAATEAPCWRWFSHSMNHFLPWSSSRGRSVAERCDGTSLAPSRTFMNHLVWESSIASWKRHGRVGLPRSLYTTEEDRI